MAKRRSGRSPSQRGEERQKEGAPDDARGAQTKAETNPRGFMAEKRRLQLFADSSPKQGGREEAFASSGIYLHLRCYNQ